MTSMNQTVSIILPTYNRAGLITETISSIVQQTYPYWELIIVDDGSTDNTEDLVLAVHDHRIRYFKEPRCGIGGKIKNRGLQKASGELIAFIDSDDLWAPSKIEKQVAALIQYPGAGFCLTGGYNFRNKLEAADYFYKKTSGLRYDNLFNSCFQSEVAAFIQTLVMRRACLDTAGWFKEEKSFSDVEFIYELAWYFKGIILYEPLVYRRLHEENFITPNWEKSHKDGLAIIRSYRKKLPGRVWSHALFRARLNLGEKYLKNKQRQKALINFLAAWRYHWLSITPAKKIIKTFLSLFTGKYLHDHFC